MPQKFVAGHVTLGGRREARAERGDVTWYQHGIDVGVLDEEALDHVGVRGANRDGCVPRRAAVVLTLTRGAPARAAKSSDTCIDYAQVRMLGAAIRS